MTRTSSTFALTLALWFATACSPPDPMRTDFDDSPDGLPPGERVEVVLRSDASGDASALTGSLVAVTNEWVVVEVDDRVHWIQRGGVLFIAEAPGE